jgi:lipid-A-disaccharide synthase
VNARPVRVFVSAGEASGDRILGATLARLRAEIPLELCGLGGPEAEAQGLVPLFPIKRTAFSGAWDVARNLPFAARMDAAARAALRRFRPDLALLVDYPGLNLRLARAARALGVPVHFIAPPQAWAYRDRERKLRRARRSLDGCSLQPLYAFEAADWEGTALRAVSGHFQDTVIPRLPGSGMVAVCPGSRLPVLRRALPVFLRLLRAADPSPGAPAAVIAPPFLAAEARAIVRRHGRPGITVRTDAYAAMSEAARALAFPGTITLELARRRVPTVVMAPLDPLTYALGRRLLASRALALPNLIAGEAIFPEWAGTRPEAAVFRALWESLPAADDPDWNRRLDRLEARLGPGDGAGVAARACLDLLAARPSRLVSPVTSSLP